MYQVINYRGEVVGLKALALEDAIEEAAGFFLRSPSHVDRTLYAELEGQRVRVHTFPR